MKATIAGLFIALAILVGGGVVASPSASPTEGGRQAAAPKEHGNLAEMQLRAVSVKSQNLLTALSDIANTYGVPIGLEVSPEDDLLKGRNIVVRLESGTLKEVLDSVVSQNPLYTWDVEDGVVNVFPKGNREPFLKTLLETRVGKFSITPNTSRFTLRVNLTGSPELKDVLDNFGVKADNQIFLSRDAASLGKDFSLELSDVTVKYILNRVIKDSGAKYWMVNRDGPQGEYLLLNL